MEQPRAVLRITGPDRTDFLQTLLTNDVSRARGGLVYAALLTPQGKYLADMFLHETGEEILLDADAAQAPGLMQRLTMYRLRAKVEIAPSDIAVSAGTGPAPEGALSDPRHPDLGWRLYGASSPDATDWPALRARLCVPAPGIELIPNDTYILEAGFERLHGVDFRKGCYVGQEVTARMRHKTTLRKGLTSVGVDGAAPVGTPITVEEREVGTLYTQGGGQGIAYLRFDRAAETMRAGRATLTWQRPQAG